MYHKSWVHTLAVGILLSWQLRLFPQPTNSYVTLTCIDWNSCCLSQYFKHCRVQKTKLFVQVIIFCPLCFFLDSASRDGSTSPYPHAASSFFFGGGAEVQRLVSKLHVFVGVQARLLVLQERSRIWRVLGAASLSHPPVKYWVSSLD
jgi:hypothetical protein